MPSQKENDVKINTSFEFRFMDVPIQTVYEREKSSDRILIILSDGNTNGDLNLFLNELHRLFAELSVGGYEEIQGHVQSLLDGTGLAESNSENAKSVIAEKIGVEVKQFFIHIVKEDGITAQVEYAFALELTYKVDGDKHGIFKIFSLNSLSLNVWNVSSDSKIYKKMGIQTIDDLLK